MDGVKRSRVVMPEEAEARVVSWLDLEEGAARPRETDT